jgi:hypothetical protein
MLPKPMVQQLQWLSEESSPCIIAKRAPTRNVQD